MINRFFFLFSAVLLSWGSYAGIASGSFPITHTQYTPELKPASLDLGNSYQIASVCFLGSGDCVKGGFNKGDDDMSIDTARQCLNEGFVRNNCNSVQEPDGICPYNSAYVKGCKCKTGLITCPNGQVGVGDECRGQYAACICDPNLVSCPAGQVGSGASCGGKYQSCVCNPSLVSCPSNKNGTGISCGGRYQGCTCKSEYVYNSSNCTSPRSLGGSTCDGLYTGCNCPTGVSSSSCPYGCLYYSYPCNNICSSCKPNPDCSVTSQSCPYGCASTNSCGKCTQCNQDNCHKHTAVKMPANAICDSYYSDCSSKCSSWICRCGYYQSQNACYEENCNTYKSAPWVVDDINTYSKCQAFGRYPSSETARCDCTAYRKCI